MIGLTSLAKNTLLHNEWPGNIRELRNSIEYAINIAAGEYLTLQELPSRIISGKSAPPDAGGAPALPDASLPSFSLQDHMNRYERDIILKTLQDSKNITAAAKRLGLTRQALQYKMQKHNIIV